MPPQAHVCRVPPPSVAPTIPLSVVMRADQLRHGPRGSARRAQSGLCRCCHFAEPCPERPAAKRQEREKRPHLCRETTGRLSMRALSPVFGIPYCVDRAHMECSVRNTGRPGATRRAARRGWDSNPRKLALRWFSRPVLSSAQSPLQSTYLVLRIRYGLRPGATRRASRRGWDLNPRDRNRPNGFRDRHIRPLCHPSRVRITYPGRNTLYVIRNTFRAGGTGEECTGAYLRSEKKDSSNAAASSSRMPATRSHRWLSRSS